MEFRAKIIAFAALLTLGAALCAMLVLTLARGMEQGIQSVTLAEEQLALYLAMETSVSDLLRLHIMVAAAPSPALQDRLDATRSAVFADIETIRGIVDEELVLRGEEEREELRRLNEITLTLGEVEAAFARIAVKPDESRSLEALAAPLTAAAAAIDDRLAPLVDAAIADEAGQVFAARASIDALGRRTVALSLVASLSTLFAAGLGVWWLLSMFMRPFGALVEGTSRVAEGDLAHRIPTHWGGEFGRLSGAFNAMAVTLEASDKALRAEEEELQRRVAERTAELKRANAQLAEQDATRRRFLADVSHELRTPLTVMRGEAEVALRARDARLSEGAEAALAGVVEQTEHMSRLVEDLLFVARREAGEARLVLRQVDLGSVLRRAVADADLMTRDGTVVLEADADALQTRVTVDAGRVHQLLMVLLDNALRYSPESEAVRVNAALGVGSVGITVRDAGIGIPDDEVPLVFDRFVRGSNALPGGTGLGLPVAKAIAEAHGGALTIASKQGEGTAVTLTLPIPQKETFDDTPAPA